jgi:hypothetical protein
MGLLGWAKKKFGPRPRRSVNARDALPLLSPEVEREIAEASARQRQSARRFITNSRLTEGQWPEAIVGQSINSDLEIDLPQVQARAAWAFTHNPIFEGVCNTFCQDVVGPNGPTLQVLCEEDPKFAEDLEEAWRLVFAQPDPGGRLGGVENMKMWVRLMLLAGSYLNVYGTRRRDETPITFAWKTVHPRRMITPLEFTTDPNVAFGIRLGENGEPVEYYLDRPSRFGTTEMSGLEFDVYPAAKVQHRFLMVDPEQLTGYPMMTSPLDTVAEIDELDGYTMEAAKSNAAHSWWLKSLDPSKVTDPDPVPGPTVKLQKGTVNVAPAGWDVAGLPASQPSTEGMAYRNARMKEFGRPIQMPLLIIMLDVSDATFSSAQFAGALYRDGIRGIQGFLERETMNGLVRMVAIELCLRTGRKLPKKWINTWTHNVPPHANIEKFVGALEQMVADGFISPADASGLLGYDWEKVVQARKRCAQDLDDAGLPPAPVNGGSPLPPEPDPAAADGSAPKPAKPKAAPPKKPVAPKREATHAGV